MIYINNLYNKLEKRGCIMKGAKKDEIILLQKKIKNKLPKSYIEFLESMGQYAPFLAGEDYSIEEVINLKFWAKKMVKEDKLETTLKEQDFIFLMSQGVLFCFFNLLEGDNPPVYYYMEGVNQKKFIKISDSFSDFLERRQKLDPTLFKRKKE